MAWVMSVGTTGWFHGMMESDSENFDSIRLFFFSSSLEIIRN